MMIRRSGTLAVAAAAIALVGCSKGASSSLPAASASPTVSTPAKSVAASAVSKTASNINCSDPSIKSSICAAFNLLKDTNQNLESLGAQVSLWHFGKKKSDRRTPTQAFAEEIAKYDKTINDAAEELQRSAVKRGFSQVKEAYTKCVKRIVDSASQGGDISDDATGQVTDSCRFPVQRSISDYFRSVGVKVLTTNAPDVFGLHWGQSEAFAQKLKGNPASSEPNELIYDTPVSGLDAIAILNFVDDKLSSLTYIFTSKHVNDNLFINDFDSVDGALQGKYGKPGTHGVYWRNDLYKDDRSHWGLAIAAGQMYMASSWETDDTEISHRLVGDNFKVIHGVGYTSREYRLVTEAAKRASSNKNL